LDGPIKRLREYEYWLKGDSRRKGSDTVLLIHMKSVGLNTNPSGARLEGSTIKAMG
jgi:hypothetical protein